MSEWQRVPLGDIADSDGFAIGPFGSRMKADNYTESGPLVVRGQNITAAGRIEGQFVHISEEFADSLGSARLCPGDIALPHRGAIGRAALVAAENLVMSTSLMRIRLNRSMADPRFIAAFLSSQAGTIEILQFASTVGTPGIGQPLASLRKVMVPLPPLEEQRRIAGVLSALDDLIDTNRVLVDRLWQQAATAYKTAASTGQLSTLGEAIELRYGKAFPARDRNPGPHPVVSSAGIVDHSDAVLVEGPGVVVGRKGTVGSVTWIFDDFFAIDTAFFVATDLPMAYAYFALREAGLEGMNTDSAVPGLNRTNALLRPLAVPTPDRLAAFECEVQAYLAAIRALDDEIADLARTRDELLPLLMSGRVRVSERLAVA